MPARGSVCPGRIQNLGGIYFTLFLEDFEMVDKTILRIKQHAKSAALRFSASDISKKIFKTFTGLV